MAIAVITTVVVTLSIENVYSRRDAAHWMQDSLLTLNGRIMSSEYLDTSIITTPSAGTSSSAVAGSVVAPEYSLAFEQSLGFFDDIPNDLWISYYQTRARKAEHYREPKKPNSRMGWTHHWNFFNWDP
jgi:hypothetical protein